MKRKHWLIIIVLVKTSILLSQNNRIATASLSVQANIGYNEIEASYAYRFYNFLDIGAAAQLQFSASETLGGTLPSNRSIEWSIDDNNSSVNRYVISPFVRASTPFLCIGKGWSISSFAEPS
jgi:hypothetical protein